MWGLTKPHLKDPRKCGQEIIPDRTQSRSLVAAAVGCCRCPADPQPKARVLPHRVILGVCHPHRRCQNPSIISRCDLAPPVCPLQGQQLKREVMKTAGHERALQGLIKGAEHSVSMAGILRQIGLEMWSGKEENQRGYLEINPETSLLFPYAAWGEILSCALTFGVFGGENNEDLHSHWEIISVCTKPKCCR